MAREAANDARIGIRSQSVRQQATGAALKASDLLFRLYLLYALFFFLNIPSRIPGLGLIRPTLLLASLILLLLFTSGLLLEKKDSSATSKRLNVLLIYMVVSLPFVQWPGSVIGQNLPQFVKAILFFFLTIKVVDTVPRLRVFLYVFIGCQIIRVLEPLFLHATTGYWGSSAHMGSGVFLDRLSGAPSDVINPNGLAYVVITALAFMHYMMTGTRKATHIVLYVLLAMPMVYALLLTGSRSGLVGFAVLALAIFFKSNRKLLLIVIGVIGLAGSLVVLNDDQKDRYFSIVSDDAKNSATAGTRYSGITKDIQVGMHRPIFGHGVGTSLEANFNHFGKTYYSHVLYTEVFVEIGAVGSLLFYLVLIAIVKTSLLARRTLDLHRGSLLERAPDDYLLLRRLADSLQVWVAMGLVFSLAQYGLSEYNWYLIGGLSVVLFNFVIAYVEQFAEADQDRLFQKD